MSGRSLAAVALASAASLLLELALTRILSATTWYHFAFAVISGALLGLGAGAMAVALLPRVFPPGDEGRGLVRSAWLASAATLVATVVLLVVRITLERAWRTVALSMLYAGSALLPFAAMGAFLALALRAGRARAPVVYGFDLVGAAAGALLFIPAASLLGAPGAALLAALLFAAAGLLVADEAPGPGATDDRRRPWIRARRLPLAAAAATVAVAAGIHSTQLAELRNAAKNSAGTITDSYWNAYSYVAVYRPVAGRPPFGWGFGEAIPGPAAPPQRMILIDLMAGTVMTDFDGRTEPLAYLRRDVTSVVYAVRDQPRVLVIGVGGGRDVLAALVAGAAHTTGVEINARLIELLTGRYAAVTGLAGRGDVTLVHDEARSWVTRTRERFDVIQASLIDTWAATASGAFALSENGIYTREAWTTFLDRLTPDGILTFTRWWVPEGGEVARLVSLALDVLERQGVRHPGRHLALLGAGPVATLLVRKTPFPEGELDRLQAEADASCFETLYLPGRTAAPGYEAVDAGPAAWRAWAAARPAEDLAAPTDDRPFFFYRTRPDAWLDLPGLLVAPRSRARLRVGFFDPLHVLVATLLGALLAALAFLVLPPAVALRHDRRGGPGARAMLYMSAVGLAFMFVEVPLLTRLAIPLGHPVLSLAVVLGGLLVAAGVGSLASGARAGRTGVLLLMALPVIVLLLAFALAPLADGMAHLGAAGRIACAALVVLAVGLPMGSGLPTGLARAAGEDGHAAPLLFGVNGAFSVLGSVLAMIVLLNAGARTTLLVGALLYVAALALLPRAAPDRR